jgi:hypothetical protein
MDAKNNELKVVLTQYQKGKERIIICTSHTISQIEII